MRFAMRIRIARQRAGFTQMELAARLGVSRAAVTNWEAADRGQPATERLQRIALITDVSFEWLATGRGRISSEHAPDDVPAANAEWVDDELELRLLRGFRATPLREHMRIVNLVESRSPRKVPRSRK